METLEVHEFRARRGGDVPRLFSQTSNFRFHDPDGHLVHRFLPAGRRGYRIVSVSTTGHQAGFVEKENTALTFPVAGHSEVRIGGQKHVVSSSDAIILGPSERKSQLVADQKSGKYKSLTVIVPRKNLPLLKAREAVELRRGDPQCFELRSLLSIAFSMSERAGERMGRKLELIEALIDEMLTDVFGQSSGGSNPDGFNATQALRIAAADQFMRQALSEPITTSEIAAAVGTSLRQLQKDFQSQVGISPRSHLANLRLRELRHKLENPDECTTVTNAALDVGLFHLSRCSSRYKGIFGELPSETLSRAQTIFRRV